MRLRYNNRPVSLLPEISKICERVALNQLTDFVTQEDTSKWKQENGFNGNSECIYI